MRAVHPHIGVSAAVYVGLHEKVRAVRAVAEEVSSERLQDGGIVVKRGYIAVVIGRSDNHAGDMHVGGDEATYEVGVGGKENALPLFALHDYGFDAEYAAGIEHAFVAVAGYD